MGSMNGAGTPPDWLARLAPAHGAPPATWWPLASGWWGLIVLLVIAIAAAVYLYSRPAARMRRTALRELKALDAGVTNHNELARRLENLMRRYAVTRFGRQQVAHLAGKRWITFLVAHHGSAFDRQVGADFLSAAWGGNENGNGDDIAEQSKQRALWIQGARNFIKEKS